jgi:hypothetical protein
MVRPAIAKDGAELRLQSAVGTGGGGGGGAGNDGSGGAWSRPAHAFCMETSALAIISTLAPSDSSVRGWAEAVDASDKSDDAAGSGEVVTGMEELGGAVVIVPGNADTRLIGLGSLPEPLRRLYGCETAGRGRGRREGAVAAAAVCEEKRRLGFYPARVSPGSLRKPETIICFCLIFQIESYKYLYVSLITIIIK